MEGDDEGYGLPPGRSGRGRVAFWQLAGFVIMRVLPEALIVPFC